MECVCTTYQYISGAGRRSGGGKLFSGCDRKHPRCAYFHLKNILVRTSARHFMGCRDGMHPNSNNTREDQQQQQQQQQEAPSSLTVVTVPLSEGLRVEPLFSQHDAIAPIPVIEPALKRSRARAAATRTAHPGTQPSPSWAGFIGVSSSACGRSFQRQRTEPEEPRLLFRGGATCMYIRTSRNKTKKNEQTLLGP